MEDVSLGYHGVVFTDLVLPMEDVPVCGTTPVTVIDARRGNMGK
jgi:hypothetical protein